MLSLLTHLLLALTAIYFYKKEPLLSFSILFYLISISVFSNLFVQVPGMMGDRFLFIPSIGVCTAVVFLFTKIFKQSFTQKQIAWKELAKPFSVSFSILLVLYSLISFSRNRDWKDRITLFSRDIKTVENSAQAQNLLAVHLLLQANNEPDPLKQKQMREESLKHFDRAIEIYPHFLNPVFDRARLLESMRRYDEALAGYKAATAIDTGFLTPYFSMGIIYQNKGMDKEAAQCYEKYLPAHPLQMEVYANLSYAYFKIEQFDKSIATNQRAIAVSPNSFDPYLNIGKTYMHLKQTDSAIVYFEKAIALKPNDTGLAATIEQLKAGK